MRVPGQECVRVVDRRLFIARGADGVQNDESMDAGRHTSMVKAKTSPRRVPGRGSLFGGGSVKISAGIFIFSSPTYMCSDVSL